MKVSGVKFSTRPKGTVSKITTTVSRRSRPRRGRVTARGHNKSIVGIVRSVLNNTLETKYVANQQQNISFNSAISLYTEAYACLPPVTLTAGSDTSARQGYEIQPVSARMNLTVALPSVARSNALKVDVYIVTRKANKYIPTVLATSGVPQLFMSGAPGTPKTLGFTGTLCQRALKFNTSEFTLLKHKSFILGGNVGLPNGDTTAGNSPNMSINGMARSFNIKLKCPKTLKYDLNSASAQIYPNNYAPIMFIGYSKLDGTNPDIVATSIIANWTTSLNFKDA